MTNTEKIIEAVEEAISSEENWWNFFPSIDEAKETINSAIREKTEECQRILLLSLLDIHDFNCQIEAQYTQALKRLKKNLINESKNPSKEN